jgi:GntR family transcriptional regulator
MLVIDKISRIPIYEQIVEGIQREILLGLIKPSDQLPSIRELALTLSANPNTIQKAFIELDRRGIIISSPGRGCYIAENALETLKSHLKAKLSEITSLSKELATGGIPEEDVISAVKIAYSSKKA